MTLMFDSGVILSGQIKCSSLLGIKGLYLLMYKVQNEQHYSTLLQYASKILKLAENFLNLNFVQCLWFSKHESILT